VVDSSGNAGSAFTNIEQLVRKAGNIVRIARATEDISGRNITAGDKLHTIVGEFKCED